jgi:hypothetical protein
MLRGHRGFGVGTRSLSEDRIVARGLEVLHAREQSVLPAAQMLKPGI